MLAIKGRENQEGFINLWPRRALKEGDEVQLTNNMMENNLARFAEFNGNDRVTLLMEIMGCQVRIKASLDKVTFPS